MQTFYIGNSLLGDELAIAQQLISDILLVLGLMYWIRRLWRQRRPIREPLANSIGAARGALWRRPIEAPHRGRNLEPY